MPLRLICARDDDDRRIDRVLRKALPQLPLSALHRLFRKGKIRLDGKKALPKNRVKTSQIIEIHSKTLDQADFGIESVQFFQNPIEKHLIPSLDIIYEGNGVIILNKPPGIAVHGPKSLAEEVRYYLAPKLPSSLSFKPGPLHRLDKATTGLIMFSTSLNGARFFSEMHKKHRIKKQYIAIVNGIVKKDEVWEDCLSGEEKSITKVKVLKTGKNNSLILAQIEAGKKHQIRKQALMHGHPLSGDKKYSGASPGFKSFCLHAYKLEFSEQELCYLSAMPDLKGNLPKKFTAPLPAYFEEKIIELFGDLSLQIMI